MSLAIEKRAPQLVVHAPRRRPVEDRTETCDFVWACILDDYDYFDNDITEYSDDNSISTEDVLRTERKKLKKMKKRESKLRKKLADKMKKIADAGEEHHSASGPVELNQTMEPEEDSILENRDAFEALYLDVMNSLTDDHDQSRDSFPSSDVQQRKTMRTDDPPELKEALGSKKVLVAGHHLADLGEPSFSTNKVRERESLVSEAGGRARHGSTHDRKETTRSVPEKATNGIAYEDKDKSRSLHKNRGKKSVGQDKDQTVAQTSVIAASTTSSPKQGSKNSRIHHAGSSTNKSTVPKRIPMEPIEQIPSKPSAKSTSQPPSVPMSDERIAAKNGLFHDGSQENPIDVVNEVSTNNWRSRSDFPTDTEWQRWTEKRANLVARADLAQSIPRAYESSHRHSRTELLTATVSKKKRDPISNREAMGRVDLLEREERTAHGMTNWPLQGSERSEVDGTRRKNLERNEALLRTMQ